MADTIKTFLPHTLAFGTRSGVTEKKFFFLRSRLLDRASCRRLAELGCVKYMYMCLEWPKIVINEDICRRPYLPSSFIKGC